MLNKYIIKQSFDRILVLKLKKAFLIFPYDYKSNWPSGPWIAVQFLRIYNINDF